MCDLMMPSVRISLRWSKDYGKNVSNFVTHVVVQHLLRSRAERCPPKIQRGSGHPRRADVPEGALDADGTGAGYGLGLSCGAGHAVRE